MFKDTVKSQVVGTLKIYDKESGDVLVQKKNAIHPVNMAYVMASAMAGKPTSVNSSGNAPSINWMQFGSGGSTSTTTLSYSSPRVYPTYDQLAVTASNSSLYVPKYEQLTTNTVYYPGEDMGAGVIVPNNTSKVKFSVNLTHADYATAVGESIPSSDSSASSTQV